MRSTVKLYRTSINKTQVEVAKELKITAATYINKERSTTSFTVKEYLILQLLFGITGEQLVRLMANMEE